MRTKKKPISTKSMGREFDAQGAALKEKFLIAYRKWGLKSRGAEEAGISIRTLARWLKEDAAFRQGYEEVQEELHLEWQEDLEDTARKRALTGRSDQLLKFLLQYLDPGYKDRLETQHSGKVTVIFNENLNLEEL